MQMVPSIFFEAKGKKHCQLSAVSYREISFFNQIIEGEGVLSHVNVTLTNDPKWFLFNPHPEIFYRYFFLRELGFLCSQLQCLQ